MSDLANILLEILTEERQSKEMLRAIIRERYFMDVSERMIRRAVTELRENGYGVCSNSTVKGYWMGTKEETAHTIAEMRSRALKLMRAADKLEGIECDGQERWFI